MPDALQRNADEQLLFPAFAARLRAGLQLAQAQGLAVYLFEGLRSPERQDVLFEQGRTTDGKIVTNARGWQSWHQFGVAGDLAFGGPGKWTWSGDWEHLGTVMEAQGLEWAGRWKSFKETPHFQLTGGLSLDKARALHASGGLPAVWAAIAAALPPVTVS